MSRKRERVFFGADSTAADELGKLRAEDMARKITEWPALAALCFALAEFDLNRMPEWGERRGRMDGGPADGLGGY